MKLVYCQRMRAESDIDCVLRIFGEIFNVDVYDFERESKEISLYWNENDVFLNDIQLSRNLSNKSDHAIVLSCQKEELKNVTECVIMEKPIILCGPTDCGKTKIINTFCTIFNKELQLDTIDDSVTGSFQQFDLNRVLEEMWEKIEKISFEKMSQGNLKLFELWREHEIIADTFESNEKETEIEFFLRRLNSIVSILEQLKSVCDLITSMEIDKMLHEINLWKKFLQNSSSSTLNTGGHFEWVDSMIVKSIKFGHYICLEHVNLVSSAILDRLNPILEPNGSLMISEKGKNIIYYFYFIF
jgi:midasin